MGPLHWHSKGLIAEGSNNKSQDRSCKKKVELVSTFSITHCSLIQQLTGHRFLVDHFVMSIDSFYCWPHIYQNEGYSGNKSMVTIENKSLIIMLNMQVNVKPVKLLPWHWKSVHSKWWVWSEWINIRDMKAGIFTFEKYVSKRHTQTVIITHTCSLFINFSQAHFQCILTADCCCSVMYVGVRRPWGKWNSLSGWVRQKCCQRRNGCETEYQRKDLIQHITRCLHTAHYASKM